MMGRFSIISASLSKWQKQRIVIGISFVGGLLWGVLGEWNWQHAVEGAQVIAGLVKYPSDNPYFIYQLKLWTLMHQIPALFLRLGFHEAFLSIIISGVMVGLAFAAFGLLIFLLSRSVVISVLLPYLFHMIGLYQYGTVYEVFISGVPTTYGALGCAWIFLTTILIAAGEDEWGLCFLGMAPAVHPSLGLFIWIIAAIILIFKSQIYLPRFQKSRSGFFLGCSITAASFLVYQIMVVKYAPLHFPSDPSYYAAFVKYWDVHRPPVHWNSQDVIINLALGLTAFFNKTLFPADSELQKLDWLWDSFKAAACLGLFFAVLGWIPPDRLPTRWVGLMPARILSFNIIAYGAVVCGICSRYRSEQAGMLLWSSLLLCLGVLFRLDILGGNPAQLSTILLFHFLVLIYCSGLHKKIASLFKFSRYFFFFLKAVSLWILLFFVGKHAWSLAQSGVMDYSQLHDWTNDRMFKTVKERPGLLLLDPRVLSIQLVSRRPVLVDVGVLDAMGYVPELTTLMEPIMKEIYGVDIRKPYPEKDLARQPLWEQRTPEEWRRLGDKYKFTDILTASDWTLKLKKAGSDPDYNLWELPSGNSK